MVRSNLIVRAATAVLLIPLFIALVFKADGSVLLAVTVAVATLALREAITLFGIRTGIQRVISLIAGIIILIVASISPGRIAECLAFVFSAVAISLLFVEGLPGYTDALGRHLISLLYVPLMLSFAFRLTEFSAGRELLFVWLVANWATDIFAYAVGIPFGKIRFTTISPKKSLEGLFGGMTGAAICCAVSFYFLFGGAVIKGIAFGLCIAIIGQSGDLVESAFKRCAGVKDSGSIVPGHGGVLDRIDSLILTAPIVFLYARYVL